MIERVSIETGDEKRALWISGPGKILVQAGKILINGAVFSEGEEIVIHKDRSFTFILDKNTVAHISVRDKNALRNASPHEQEILLTWMETAQKIVEDCEREGCTIAVVGGVDSGKTTFAVMLSNMSAEKGLETVFIDADLGQSTVGLPGFIAVKKYTGKNLWPRNGLAEKYFFVGSVSPLGVEEKALHAISKIMREDPALNAKVRVIDTDGWIEGYRAVDYKQKILLETETTHTVLVYANEYHPYLRAIKKVMTRQVRVYEIDSPPNRIIRSRNERVLLRKEKMKQYFKDLPIKMYPLGSLFITGTILLGYGEQLNEDKLKEESSKLKCNIIYGEKLGNKKVFLTNKKCMKKEVGNPMLIPIEDFMNRVVGLLGEDGHSTYPGLVVGIRENKRLLIKTAYNGKVTGIIVGYIIL